MDKKSEKKTFSGIENILSSIPGGVVKFDLLDEYKIEFITNKMLEMLGCNQLQFEEHYNNKFLDMIYYEDRDMLKEHIALLRDDNNGDNIEIKCRIVDFNNYTKWLLVTLQIYEISNESCIVYAIVTDIDMLKKVESLYEKEKFILQQENDKYRMLLNKEADVFFEYNIEEDYIYLNNSLELFAELGSKIYRFTEFVKKSNKIIEEDKKIILDLANIDEKADAEFRYLSIDGSCVWCQIKAVVINDENGQHKNIVGCINNIDKEKKERDYKLEIIKRDPLTHLYNAQYTATIIDDYISGIGKDGNHTMFIVDLDNFREINEKLGTMFGDVILVNIAENFQRTFYNSDIVGRIGGDEFLIFIKNLSADNVLVDKIEEVKRIISATYVGETLKSQITCSIGVANYPRNGSTYKELFKNADKALYYAKMLGRNRYELFDNIDDENIASDKEEFYNNYTIDCKKIEFSSFNREITTFAFDIMARTKDVTSAINLILDKIGKQFDATYVNIVEFSSKKVIMTYNWNITYTKRKDGLSFKADERFIEEYAKNFDENGIFAIEDTSVLDNNFSLKWLFDRNNVKSFMQCAIIEAGNVVACLSLLDSQKKRKWTRNEIDSLAMITKVIAQYLLKIRASQKMEERLNEFRNYDSLTNLPTLYKFKNDARNLLADNQMKKYVMLNMDFYRFKAINDTYGYEVGDEILIEFGRFISSKENMTIINCRVTSDNFLAIMEFANEEDVVNKMNEVSKAFNKLQRQKNNNLNIRMCMGACVIESNIGDIIVSIDNSNIARKYAKENSYEYCYFFNDHMKEKIKIEFEITNTMEKALAHNEFKVYFQPKVCLNDGSLAGAEALVRWVKPDKSVMSPDKFIPLFEKNGFVVNLDFFVYEEVCKMIREWLDNGKNAVPISVNVSRVHLYDENFVNDFCDLINKYNIPNEYIELELTESIFLDNTEVAIATMRRFRGMGFKVSIDDFGAGYSSLNLLKEMASDVLKLDKGFFGRGELQKEEQIIVSSIVNMAKQLNMKVLSEGVETSSQSKFLKNINCDLAQGYLYAKPMPKEEFEKLMKDNLQFEV